MDKETNQKLLELYGELESKYKELGKTYYNYGSCSKTEELGQQIYELSEKLEEMEDGQ